MIHRKPTPLSKPAGFLLGLVLLSILAGCGPGAINASPPDPLDKPLPKITPTESITPSKPAPSATVRATATRTPTSIPPTPTPPPLEIYQTDRLYDNILPVTYLEDACQYLYDRWDPDNASPGTIVLPFMYHGVRKAGGSVVDNITVTQKYFEETMARARELGYETITMRQLENFLQHNAYIPPRSMLLIIDDRRLGTVREHFLPILEENQWELTMAYITGVINQNEWNQVKEVLRTGRVRIEAHGYLHNGETYFTEFTPDEIIHQEIYAPIEAFEANLGYRPTAFIYPGGDFTEKAVRVVREAGYQLGFTIHARGPIMFNWIPQGEKERAIGDPLLTLPRYWSTSAYQNLEAALDYAEEAARFAWNQRESELSWYAKVCPGYPPIPEPALEITEEACRKCQQ